MVSPGTTTWPAPPWKPSCRHATTAAVCKQQLTMFACEWYAGFELMLIRSCMACCCSRIGNTAI